MANTKISALTSSTTPLAGTEVLPIVQSSATVKVSVANLTAGRAVSAASLALTTSPLPATSGGTGSSSAFTSNGVVYANSTTTLATGTALVFDGTNLGVGVASPTKKLDILSNTSQDGIRISGSANPRLTIIDTTTPVQFDAICTDTEVVLRTDTNHPLVLSTNGTEAMRIGNTGNVTVSIGNLVIGTSGKGIDFSATPGTGTSELFADYEEGTWTATIEGTTTAGTASYTAQTGSYTKVGNIVAITLYLDYSGGTGTGNLRIAGLPYTSVASRYQAITIGQLENITKTAATQVLAQMNPGTTKIQFVEIPSVGGANAGLAYDAAGNIFLSGTYFV